MYSTIPEHTSLTSECGFFNLNLHPIDFLLFPPYPGPFLHLPVMLLQNYRITRNFRGSIASYYFVIKHSQLLMMDLRIMPAKEIIRHKTFAVVRKTTKSAKVSCHKSFVLYGIQSMSSNYHKQTIDVLKQYSTCH